MTSTTSEPTVRSEARDSGRRPLRSAASAAPAGSAAGTANGSAAGAPGPASGGGTPAERAAVPVPNVPVLHRPRVTELIERASAKHRVTLICAPSGAGKTVACAEWAASGPAAGRVGWLSLDFGDWWPRQLWAGVRSALAAIPALPAEIARDLPDPADEEFPLRLAAAAQGLTSPVALVIDDLGDLSGASVVAGVDELVRHAPPTLRLVLAGRHPAGLQVARLRVGGDLAEIGADDLACTPQEAEDYFRMLGHDVPRAERDELLRRTEGWMTGLRLAAIRSGPGRPASSLATISGAEPPVADYLWDEVLASLPPDRRLFLLRTSVADLICGDLADALTGTSDSAVVLDELSRQNLMVRPADADEACADDTEYRYHPLLLDMLRARLRRELPGESVRLTRRASRWLAAHGRHAEAIRAAARTGDWDFAGRVLAEAGPAMLVPGPAAELEPVLASFPVGRFAGDAAVAGALAAAGLRTGDTCAAALHLDNAEQALAHCAPAKRQRIRTWLHALRLMTAPGEPPARLVERSLAIAAEAEHEAPGAAEQQGLGLLWCAVGVAELAGSDVNGARASFARARGYLRDARPEFAARAQAWQALADAVYGDLLAAAELAPDPASADLASTGPASTELAGPAGVGTAAAADGQAGHADPLTARLSWLAAAHVHLARDEQAAARAALDRCEPGHAAPGSPSGQPAPGAPGGRAARPARQPAAWPAADPMTARVISQLAAAARARLALADGDVGAARAIVSRLRYQDLTAGQGAAGGGQAAGAGQALERFLGPIDADIAIREGDHNRARLALVQAAQAATQAGHGAGGLGSALLLAQARLLLAQGDNRGALQAARQCLEDAAGPAGVTLAERVGALVTAAVAARRTGQAEQAAGLLADALAVAEPHGIYRPFLDGGSAARSALTVLIRPVSAGAALAARILQRFEVAPAPPAGQSAAMPLTGSELAVLRFLPSHMTNQEIADALFLSINTVKTHLRSIYRKLGVTTRRQAIARAGKLGLL